MASNKTDNYLWIQFVYFSNPYPSKKKRKVFHNPSEMHDLYMSRFDLCIHSTNTDDILYKILQNIRHLAKPRFLASLVNSRNTNVKSIYAVEEVEERFYFLFLPAIFRFTFTWLAHFQFSMPGKCTEAAGRSGAHSAAEISAKISIP